MSRRRADSLLAERGLVRSRARAAEAIRAGLVRVGEDGPTVQKPGDMVPEESDLRLASPPRYVSRGGVKLENALVATGVDPTGRDCLDIGASTGGFTDCLLQHGASRVVALDVARGQLDWKIRTDERVVALERRNARELDSADLPFRPSLAVVDVSFISLTKVLPAVAPCLTAYGELLSMVKPQFELGPGRAPGGVVRSAADRREAIATVARVIEALGLRIRGLASSGLPGPKGNHETFVWAQVDSVGTELSFDLDVALGEVEP